MRGTTQEKLSQLIQTAAKLQRTKHSVYDLIEMEIKMLNQQKVLETLKPSVPVMFPHIAARSCLSVRQASVALSQLEVMGLVRRMAGSIWVRV